MQSFAGWAPTTPILSGYRPAWAALEPNGVLAIAERDAVDPDSRANGMKSLGEWLEQLELAGFVDVRAQPTGAELGGRIYVISGRKPENDGI